MNEATLEKLSERAIDTVAELAEAIGDAGRLHRPEDRHGKQLLRKLHEVTCAVRKLARVHSKTGEIRMAWRQKVERAAAEIEERRHLEESLHADAPSMDFELIEQKKNPK